MTDGEVESQSKKPFHESNWFRGTVAVVGLLGALWAFVGLPTPSHVVSEATANKLPLRNVEIVLDASSRMGAQFGKASKLEVAAEAVDQYVVNDENIGLSLRRAGGSCGQETDQLVDFDDGQTAKIAAAAKEQRPSGESNWASPCARRSTTSAAKASSGRDRTTRSSSSSAAATSVAAWSGRKSATNCSTRTSMRSFGSMRSKSRRRN